MYLDTVPLLETATRLRAILERSGLEREEKGGPFIFKTVQRRARTSYL